MPVIEKWALVNRNSDPYKAPEQSAPALRGWVDGEEILTSLITKTEGRNIITKSGTVYELGTPDPNWIHFLSESGRYYNPDDPCGGLFSTS